MRREYHSKDHDMAEKDMFVQKRINNLKRWKAQALTHMELIFTRLKEAVPLTSFEEVQ